MPRKYFEHSLTFLDIQKLQLGSIDFLAILIKASLSEESPDILPVILKYITGQTACVPSVRICLFNVLVSATKMVQLASLQRFAKWIVNPLISVAHGNVESVYKGASLQVLFTLCFQLAGDAKPYGTEFLQLALASLSSSDALVIVCWSISSLCRCV